MSLGDLVDSFYSNALRDVGAGEFEAGPRGGGLRGGSFAITERTFRLDRYDFVPGVRLSSRWRTQTNSTVLGPLHIDGPRALDGLLRLRESDASRPGSGAGWLDVARARRCVFAAACSTSS